MSYLRSSSSHIWNINAVLGKGATGAVYNGINKVSGETVAVKCFNHLSHMRPYEVQRREFEVLKKVNHQNIVRLLAIEEENESKHKVLVMELCTGGSLFNILDDPINCHGLEEKEFLSVLKHLSAGMKHLKENNIIHRDLKPGNIMKYVGEDGISIYKLTDFGAARELEEDQQFMSLYGTEEYLHPDMYERAVLRKSAGKSFHANVDLWSIGVTLFHIATGSLPFRPFGGRKNKETMFKITTEKQSGIISGIQHSENGDIEWSRTLPKTCLLSPALQQLVTPLLAGLMECDAYKMWTFEKFFHTVTFITSHQIVNVFYVNHMKDVVIYIPSSGSINDLNHRIELSTNVPAKSQLLLYNKQTVLNLEEIETTSDRPLILLNSDTTKMKSSPLMSSTVPKFPDLHVNLTNCDQDAQLAKLCASMAYSVQRIIHKCVLYYQLANSIPKHVICLIETNVKLLKEKQSACSHYFDSLQHQLQYLGDTSTYLKQLPVAAVHNMSAKQIKIAELLRGDSSVRAGHLFKNLSDYWNGLLPKMNYMSEKSKRLHDNWMKDLTSCDESMNTASARSRYYCQKIRDSWQTLHKDKSSRVLSSTEDQLHQLEKIKIEHNCKKLSDLLCSACYQGLNEVTEKLEDWYTGAQVAIVQSECLFKELTRFVVDCEEMQLCLAKIQEEQKQVWNESGLSTNTIAVSSSSNASSSTGKHSIEKMDIAFNLKDLSEQLNNGQPGTMSPNLIEELENLKKNRARMFSVIEENQSIMTEFESLVLQQQSGH